MSTLIEKLEALLEPMTEYMDKPRNCNGAYRFIKAYCVENKLKEISIRDVIELYNDHYEQSELDYRFNWGNFRRNLDSEMEGVLYEEIFTTMKGIIQKQHIEIQKLNDRMDMIESRVPPPSDGFDDLTRVPPPNDGSHLNR